MTPKRPSMKRTLLKGLLLKEIPSKFYNVQKTTLRHPVGYLWIEDIPKGILCTEGLSKYSIKRGYLKGHPWTKTILRSSMNRENIRGILWQEGLFSYKQRTFLGSPMGRMFQPFSIDRILAKAIEP